MLSAKQLRAIEHLTSGCSRAETARRVGVGETTIRRWLRAPEFQAALREAQGEVWRMLLGRLGAVATSAVDALHAALQDGQPSLRVRAADVLLARLVAVKQVVELEQRLAALEAELAELREARDEGEDRAAAA
ncbi:MAG: hypothetical protein NZ693_09830 [Thermoflexales bacterium]|nr:hypothetical protein [Thermoflexales bacterium]